MPKSNYSCSTIAQTREEREGRRRRRGLWFFSWWDRRGKKMMILTAPRTSTSPHMDVDASNSLPSTFSYHNPPLVLLPLMLPHPRCPTSAGSWILIAVSSSRFHLLRNTSALVIPTFCQPFFSKTLGRKPTRTSTLFLHTLRSKN